MSKVDRAAELAELGHQGPLAAIDLERVERALADDPDPRVRAAAAGALVRAGVGDAPRRAFVAAIVDPSPDVRRRGAELAPGCSPDAELASRARRGPRRSRRHRGGGRGLGTR